MQLGVERLPRRVQHFHPVLLEEAEQLLVGQGQALADGLDGGFRRAGSLQAQLQAVDHRQQVAEHAVGAVLEAGGDFALGAFAHIVGFGGGAQALVPERRHLLLRFGQPGLQRGDIGNGVGRGRACVGIGLFRHFLLRS